MLLSHKCAWDHTRPIPTPNLRINLRCDDGQVIKLRVYTKNDPEYDVKEDCMSVWLVPITQPTMSEQAWMDRLARAFQNSLRPS
jgi:hypothetical protein